MKRVYLIILFFIVTLIPFNIKAYDIENYYIDAELKINGDLEVKEYYEMNGYYNGSFNEVYFANPNAFEFDKNISIFGYSNIYDGKNVVLHEIRGIPKDSNFDFSKIEGTVFEKNDYAEKGDYGYYTVDVEENGDKYTIYLPSNKNEAFYLNYTIENFAVLHNDVGELWWKRFDRTNNTQSIGYLRIKVTFPNNLKEFRVWAHGPLNGTVKKVGVDTLLAEVTGLNAYTDISVRSTFDKNVISESVKRSDINALSKILAYEEDKASEANYEREQRYNILKNEFLETLNTCKKEPDRNCYNYLKENVEILENVYPGFKNTYLDTIETIHMAVNEREEKEAREAVEYFGTHLKYDNYEDAKYKVDILENHEVKKALYYELEIYLNGLKKIERIRDTMGMTLATVFIIIGFMIYTKAKYKYEYEGVNFKQKYLRDIPKLSPSSISYLLHGKITNESVSAEILNMIDNKFIDYEKRGNDYYLSYTGDTETMSKLNFKEEALIDLIFGKKYKVKLNTLKKAKTYNEKLRRYDSWVTYELRASNEGKDQKLVDKPHKKYKVTAILFGIIIFNIVLISYMSYTNHYSITTCLVAGIGILMMIILLLLHASIINKTDRGKEEFAKINAFKNFIKDFGRLDEKDLPEVHLWSKYLVYATVLGCATKLLKVMKVRIQELHLEEELEVIPINYISRLSDNYIVKSKPESPNTGGSYGSGGSDYGSWSSGSGDGGGFSSSSSGGGGGGGVGRF